MLAEVSLREIWKTCCDRASVEVGRCLNITVFRNADCKTAIPHAQRQSVDHVGICFCNKIAARNSQVDCTFGAQDRDVISTKKRDINGYIVDWCKQAAILAAETEASFFQEFDGAVGETAFAGNADAEVGGHGSDGGFQVVSVDRSLFRDVSS